MTDFDPDVRDVLVACKSVVQLEVLLLLHRAPFPWTAERVAQELRIDAEATARELDDLCDRGLLVRADGAVRFPSDDAQFAALVDRVAAAYTERRVTVIGLIYSQPLSAVHQFSEAFRIRRKDDPHG